MFIALCGFARSGKDTLADYLVERHEFTKRAYADPLRDLLYRSNLTVVSESGRTHESLCALVDSVGWEGVKSSTYGTSARRLMQTVGTEGVRGVLGDDVWSNLLLQDLPDRLVVPDMRFDIEYNKMREHGAIVVKLQRDGIVSANAHRSEDEHLKWDVDLTLDVTNLADINLYQPLEDFLP